MGWQSTLVLFGLLMAGLLGFAFLRVREKGAQDNEALAQLATWAAATGWTVERQPPDAGWARRVSGHDGERMAFVVRGAVDGRPVAVAEYRYRLGLGREQRPYERVLLVAQLREPVRTVAVHRRKDWQKTPRQLEFDRATLVGVDAFDQHYRVVTPVPPAGRNVIGEHLIAEQVAGRLPEWSVQGTDVLVVRDGHIGNPSSIPAQLSGVLRVAALIEADAGTGGE